MCAYVRIEKKGISFKTSYVYVQIKSGINFMFDGVFDDFNDFQDLGVICESVIVNYTNIELFTSAFSKNCLLNLRMSICKFQKFISSMFVRFVFICIIYISLNTYVLYCI